MREGRHNNCIKESGFSGQYLSLNWHQAFFSGSMETQESVPRGVLGFKFCLIVFGQVRGGWKILWNRLTRRGRWWIKNWNPILLSMCLFPRFPIDFIPTPLSPSPRLTYMIPWWLFQLQPYISREAWAPQLLVSSDPLNPEGPTGQSSQGWQILSANLASATNRLWS